ncbi:MAG: acyl-CoA dehydrogenase family protein [Deltaproteobacteria bacterium]|nr:acyl-CoA dehydrogenase family protein [Deltaproteobacteria bacterium]MBW2052335.1 acyl-CoA dehydrogenase family protein [Deltaproteobacteria bacterium]
MEFRLSEKEQAFYEEVEEFLKKELPSDWAAYNRAWPGGYASGEIPGAGIREAFVHYRQKLMEKGWLTIAWPKEYGGREYTYMEKAIFDERTSYYRAPNVDVIAVGMVGPTILEIGTEEQKQEWLPRIASGEVSMWLGYSEPNAGSDLAGIQTTAVEEGDEYIINGQKVWSSGAHVSDYAWLIARTDPTATRHKGVSFFIVDSKSPGITVRPLINIFGTHHFNEVFFDNVRVPKKNLIGQKNMGFYYLMTALDFERVILVGIGGFKRIFEELVEHVKRTERQGKPLKNYQSVRLKLARIATEIEIGYMLFWRTAEMLDKGLSPTVESSALKLTSTELSRKLAEVAMDVFGPYSLIEEETEFTPFRGMAPRGYIDCISATIGAGTSEIQRNIIALRGLGLPRG